MRALVLSFSCWLFGHQLDMNVDDLDARRCECGRRRVSWMLISSAHGEIRKANWRPR